MKKVTCVLFLFFALSGISFAEKTKFNVEDRFCGSYLTSTFSKDEGETWNKINPKAICVIMKNQIQLSDQAIQKIESVRASKINGADFNVIYTESDVVYFIGTNDNDHFVLHVQIKGKEVIRFLCLKQ